MSYSNKMTYINRKKAVTLGLESKYGLTRDDGYFFAWYYMRNNKIYEMWHSPTTREKYKIRHGLDYSVQKACNKNLCLLCPTYVSNSD